MEQELERKIKTRFAQLPEDIQKAVRSADVNKKIQEVAAKHQLHIDQTGVLGDEVLMAMMGFTDVAEFADNISKHLSVTLEKADDIALDIGTALFIPIRESMQKFMEERSLHETILSESKAPAAQTPPAVPIVINKPSVPPAPTIKPAEVHPADLMLMQKTVSVAPTVPKPIAPAPPTPPVAPQPYKADPYREPTE